MSDKKLKVIKGDESDKPWYKNGLHFKCTQCGACCTGAPGFVWVTPEEIEAIAQHLGQPLDDFVRQFVRQVGGRFSLKEKNGSYDCIFLKGRKCSIYNKRPKQCRAFPWWIHNLSTPEAWETAAEKCEGINHPDALLVSFEEIQDKMSDF